MSNVKKPSVKFSLIENALDSIDLGLEYFYEAKKVFTPRKYKQCLINMFHGSELILKELLRRVDVVLIFDKNSLFKVCEKPLTPTDDELYKVKSIDINTLCSEVLRHYPVEFKGKINIVSGLAKERNKIQHFAIDIDPEVLSKLLTSLYVDVFKPSFKIILSDLSYVNPYNSPLEKQIIDSERKFLDIQGDSDNYLAMCPKCENHPHFILYKGTGYPVDTYCICCDYKNVDIDASELFVCPECGNPSLIYDEDNLAGVCLYEKCYYAKEGGFVEMRPCERCDGFIIEDSCPTCDEDVD
ncbi:hypothetical protein YQ06_000933 [Salmonella enterica subsp. diarizonae]|nr:hypothetical protein [Salmonella enterica subsp. diarizonae]EIV5153284.1 hypothetical protein [Salmonella enterica]